MGGHVLDKDAHLAVLQVVRKVKGDPGLLLDLGERLRQHQDLLLDGQRLLESRDVLRGAPGVWPSSNKLTNSAPIVSSDGANAHLSFEI